LASRVVVLALATDKHPWAQIQTEAQQPLFMAQANDEVVPFWIYGRPPLPEERTVIGSIEKQIRRDRYWQLLGSVTGQRPIRYSPDRLSNHLTSIVGRYHHSRVRRAGNNIYLDIPEGLATLGLKTLWAFEYLTEHESFSSVLRTNTSSYFDFQGLLEYVNSNGFVDYSGYNIRMGEATVASGAGIVMSCERVTEILRHRDNWNHGYMDDQALGVLSKNLEFSPPSHIPRFDFNPNVRREGEIRDAINADSDVFHWRCKSADFRLEITRMRELSVALESRRKS